MLKLKQITQTVRGFLSGFLSKEFLIFLFFLALSGVFWLMKTLDEVYEEEFPICVRLVGVPKNIVMTSEMSDTIRVTVRDKGFQLLSYSTGHKFHPIVLNFNTYANKQTGHGEVLVSDLQKYVRQQLYASSSLTLLKADRLDFYFNYGRNKRVRVKLLGNVVPARNYYLAHVQFKPDNVVVYASKESLDQISEVSTEYLNIVNFDDTVTRTVKLKAIHGAKIVPQTVRMTLYPDILTEGSLEVPIAAINKPAGLIIRTFPQRVRVKFTAGANVFRLVRPSDFSVVVNYKEIAAHPSDKCKLYLRSHSRFATNASLDMSQVDYLIEQQ
ncbi:MAG: YbbR-like domain-containing protein [Prevotellaceae bacterium]|nr:YbbR-like domain-containing protein [Prevotellaceae bacterium]